jgi:hypothetical protein
MPHNLGTKKMKPKHRDIHIRTRGDLMAILWRDKQDIHMLMNIHSAPAYSNFCDVGRKAIKLQIVMKCKHHMGYVDKRSMMANGYSINHLTLKRKKKLLFHLLDLAILHS